MKLPDLLKLAVEEQDWLKVCAVYTAITGKPLAPPKKKVSLLEMDIPDDLLESINATRNDDDDDEDDEYEDFPEVPVIEQDDEVDDDTAELLIEAVDPEPVEVEDSKKKDGESEFAISHGLQNQKASSDGNGTIMKKVPMGGSKMQNKFKDNLSVKAGDLKKNNPLLKKIYGKAGGTRASRDLIDAPDTAKTIGVQCSLCDKKQKVTLALARGYNKDPDQNTYRCNECDTPSGRARSARRNRDLGVYDG
jgi:hypothetical protein